MGRAAEAEEAAVQLVGSLRARLRRVAGLVAGRRRPRVLSLEGLDPLCLGAASPPSVRLPPLCLLNRSTPDNARPCKLLTAQA